MKQNLTFDLEQLRTLRSLREHGTVTATAANVHLTPSAVSQQLAALSRSVGAPLLVREGRGVRLTEQAIILLGHGEDVLTQLERARSDIAAFAAGEVGTVSIGAFGTAIEGLVIPSLSFLSRDRPGINVVINEIEPPACFNALDAGTIDLVITVDNSSGPKLDDHRYHRIELLRDPLRVVIPSSHQFASRRSVTLKQLSGEPWIVGTEPHPCSTVTLAAFAAVSVTPRIVHRCNDWQAVMSLVACGTGLALVPQLALGISRTDVIDIRITPQEPVRSIYAAVRRGSENAPHIAAVIKALTATSHRGNGG